MSYAPMDATAVGKYATLTIHGKFLDSLGEVRQADANLLVVQFESGSPVGYNPAKMLEAIKQAGFELFFLPPGERISGRHFESDPSNPEWCAKFDRINNARVPIKYALATAENV